MMSLLDNAGNDRIVQLGIAQTAANLLPASPLASAARSVLRRGGAEHLAYGRPAGEAALAVQIARLLMRRGCQIDPDELVITNGCQQALMLALLAVAEPGDTVAVESPTYPGMLHAIEALGMQVIEIPSDPTTGICLDALRSAIGQWPVRACYVMPTVSNPLGSSMCESDRRRLIQLLSEAQIPLIEDDTTASLQFAERASTPLKAHDSGGRVLTCSSFSKTVGAGYRIGWMVPGRYAARVRELKYVADMGNAGITQAILAQYLARGTYWRDLRRANRIHREAVTALTNTIARHFPHGTRWTEPSGGFLVWVELPQAIDGEALHREALQQDIHIAAGSLFSASNRFPNCVRIGWGGAWNDGVERAVAAIGAIACGLQSKAA